MEEELTVCSGRSVCTDLGEIHAITFDCGEVGVSHGDLEVRQGGVAGEDNPAGLLVQLGAVDSVPVCEEHLVADEHERGARVDDGLAVGDGGGLAADLCGCRADLPEAAGAVDGDGSQVADEGAGVDVAELVRAQAAGDELCGEHREGQVGHDVVEKGLLLVRADRVEAREGQADQAVGRRVRHERVGYHVR